MKIANFTHLDVDAKKARILSEANLPKIIEKELDSVLSFVLTTAESGRDQCTIATIRPETVAALKLKGFYVQTTTTGHIVSW